MYSYLQVNRSQIIKNKINTKVKTDQIASTDKLKETYFFKSNNKLKPFSLPKITNNLQAGGLRRRLAALIKNIWYLKLANNLLMNASCYDQPN